MKTRRVRPFLHGAKIGPLGCSRPLQRAIVDFAADQPFAQARAKVREHDGVEVGESTIQRITHAHAQRMLEAAPAVVAFPETPGRHASIVVESDGGMVPIVEPDADRPEKRRGRRLSWREAKLSLAHAQGSRTPVDAGTIEGGVEVAGRQGSYLIDFDHVCEYLSAAAEAVAPDVPAREAWVEAQKKALKDGRLTSVLGALSARHEGDDVADEKVPVRACHRYLSARATHRNYRLAAEAGLPIGSGEIESAHRYVVQQRLKRPGVWWRVTHADAKIALRTVRINGDGNAYWANRDPKTLPVANSTASDRATEAAA